MSLGVVKPADDEDFRRLKKLAESNEGWSLVYNKESLWVWTKTNDVSSFKVLKIKGVYPDVKVSTLYDVIQDPSYRKIWDPTIIEGREICRIDANNDIGYYAMQLPKPLANRDFVTLRSWLDLGKEKIIVNHSVNHASVPPTKSFVRGISYITGYLIKATSENPDLPGCELIYVTQSDPKGNLPSWVVNKATQWLAPKVISKLHKASLGYEEWKEKNNPQFKPWMYPHQSSLPPVNSKDILCFSSDDDGMDENYIREEDVKVDTMIRQ